MNNAEALRLTLNVCIWLLAAMAIIWVVGLLAMLPPSGKNRKKR